MTESVLIDKSISGDLDSFEKLISKYQVYAYNIAFRMMKNPEDAKDASQEAFIKVFKNIKKFNSNSSFSTWLYRIVINTCKDELRKKTENVSLDEKNEEFEIVSDNNDEYNPVISYERKYVKNTINEAIKKLPINNRSVLILRDIQGYSYEEIASIENVSIGTVKSRINRARKSLRDILKMELHERRDEK